MSTEADSSPSTSQTRRKYKEGDVIVGKYRLVSTLGTGGMGEVWEAHNTLLDAPVAIKLIRAELDESSAAERLVQEARAAARLGHAAIVRVFDVGETSYGDPFIVMERLVGQSLEDILEREHRLHAVSAIQILLPIADALAMAHLKGIVHRDIKPANIFIAEGEGGEQPKLLDFGVVKFENAEHDTQLTQMGTVVGSPDYLSPEQARGDTDLDYRIDIWAFSVVVYQLLTGRTPFTGANYNALLRSIVDDRPIPTTEFATGDVELWQILERGLRKDKEERWGSMLEFGRALAAWAFSHGVDEDICGTGLEAKWLGSNKNPGRMSLLSVHEEDPKSTARNARSRARPGQADTSPSSSPLELPGLPSSSDRPALKRPLVVGIVGIVTAGALGIAVGAAFSSGSEAAVPVTTAPKLAQATQPTETKAKTESKPNAEAADTSTVGDPSAADQLVQSDAAASEPSVAEPAGDSAPRRKSKPAVKPRASKLKTSAKPQPTRKKTSSDLDLKSPY